jgi:hypothetical protein
MCESAKTNVFIEGVQFNLLCYFIQLDACVPVVVQCVSEHTSRF